MTTNEKDLIHSDFVAMRRMMWSLMVSLLLIFAGGTGSMFLIQTGNNERLAVLENEAKKGGRYTDERASSDWDKQQEFNQTLLVNDKKIEGLVQGLALEVRELSVKVGYMSEQLKEMRNNHAGNQH